MPGAIDRDELKRRVDSIIASAGDDERAHGDEDRLHLDLIRAFCPKWAQTEVERLSAADFGRYCA